MRPAPPEGPREPAALAAPQEAPLFGRDPALWDKCSQLAAVSEGHVHARDSDMKTAENENELRSAEAPAALGSAVAGGGPLRGLGAWGAAERGQGSS